MKLEFADLIVVIIYVVLIFYIGFITARKKEKENSSSKDEFLLAGRKLTLPIFVATLVATWYGSILGIGEFVYNSGIVAWVCFGLPYYIAAALFGAFAAKKIREANFSSIPEQISFHYGKNAGVISSVIVLLITIPAAYILMLGIIIQIFTGWHLWIAVTTGTVISLAYLFTGGFRADVYTNTAQFVLMYVGFGAFLYFTMIHFGSFDIMAAKLPSKHLSFLGGFGWQYVAAWFIIALQTYVDPAFHQRCSAAKTPKTARNGILVSIIFWIIFDFMTLTTGLYAKAFLNIANPLLSYPVLGDMVLPVVWKGIFIVSLLAIVMSTLDSYTFISGATIGNDLLSSHKRFKKYSPENLTKIGMAITGIIGIIIAIAIPSAVEIIYKSASIAVPGLIVPLILTLRKNIKLNGKSVIMIMLTGSIVSLIWTVGKEYKIEFFNMFEPMFPGIIAAILISVFFITKFNKK
jgi:SSS family solute:Na+ symporter